MGNRELYERILQAKVREVGFDDFKALVEERGFRFDRVDGDTWVFEHRSRPGMLGVKACDGRIQAFQALYLLRLMERHGFAAAR